MQGCNCARGGDTLSVFNFGVWALGVCWRFKLSDTMRPETLENSAYVDLLGDLQYAFLGVAVNARLQRPLNFTIVGDNHILAEFVKNHLPGFLTLGVAQHKKVVHVGPNQHPPPIRGSHFVYSVVILKWNSSASLEELFQVLLPCSGSLLGSVKGFSEAQNKFVSGKIGQVMTVWLFDPDFFLDWGVNKSIFDIPMFASEARVRVVDAHEDAKSFRPSDRGKCFVVVDAFALEATHGSKTCLEFDN